MAQIYTHEQPIHAHESAAPAAGARAAHDYAHMVADFRRRFWVSFVLTFPILALSPGFWELFGLRQPLLFPGHHYVLFCCRASSISTAAGPS